MLAETTPADDYTFRLAAQSLAKLKQHGLPAQPVFYELLYTYVSGVSADLRRALDDQVATHGDLSVSACESLHARFVAAGRALNAIDVVGQKIGNEIDQVVGMVQEALGQTQVFGTRLDGAAAELEGDGGSREEVRTVVDSLIDLTRDISTSNQRLEAGLIESRSEIERLKLEVAAARREAVTDVLTTLSNRKGFEPALALAIENARRGRSVCSLLVADIDHFKKFNDTYGHPVGDQVLRLVGGAIRQSLRPDDFAARYGGEEFAVILHDTPVGEVVAIAERLRIAVQGKELVRRSTGEKLGQITISIGVAHFEQGDDETSLVGRADRRLYEAKRAGRNRVVAIDPVDQSASQ